MSVEVQVSGREPQRKEEKLCSREPYLFSNEVTVTLGSGTNVIPT